MSSRNAPPLWEGALRDDTKNGCVADYDDGDSDENGKKKNRFRVKQQLCSCITFFCSFLCRHCTTTTWNAYETAWLPWWKILLENPGNAISETLYFKMSLDALAFKNLCLRCEFQSHLLFIISLLFKNVLTALALLRLHAGIFWAHSCYHANQFCKLCRNVTKTLQVVKETPVHVS